MIGTLGGCTKARSCRCFHAGQHPPLLLVLLAFNKFKESNLSVFEQFIKLERNSLGYFN